MNGADPRADASDPASQSSPTLGGGSVETLSPPRPRRRRRLPTAVLLAGGVGLLALGSALAAIVIRVVAAPMGVAPAAAPMSTGSATAIPDPSPGVIPDPAPSAGAAQASAAVSAPPPPAATAHHVSHGGAPAHVHTHSTTGPKGGTGGTGPNLDIQRER